MRGYRTAGILLALSVSICSLTGCGEPKIEQLLKLRQRYKFHIVIDGGVTWEILERLWKKGVEGFVLGKQILFEKNEDYRTIIQKVRNI